MKRTKCATSTALLSKECDGFFKNSARRSSHSSGKGHPFPRLTTSLDKNSSNSIFRLVSGAFPPTCALRKHNSKNSSRNLVEHEPDNAIPVALRGLSARKQEVNTSHALPSHVHTPHTHTPHTATPPYVALCVCAVCVCSCLEKPCVQRLIFSKSKTQHTIKTNADRGNTSLRNCMCLWPPRDRAN